jgi:hypothetical protein
VIVDSLFETILASDWQVALENSSIHAFIHALDKYGRTTNRNVTYNVSQDAIEDSNEGCTPGEFAGAWGKDQGA